MSTPAETAAALLQQAAPITPLPSEGTGGSSGPAWYDGVKDADLKGYLANKKFASPEELAISYKNLEGVYGADKAGRAILKPNDQLGADGKVTKRDEAGWQAFNKAIGVPEKAEDYKLPVPEGDDGVFAKTASAWLYKAGVPVQAGQVIAQEWNNFIAQQVQEGRASDEARAVKETADLKAEWGDKYDGNVEMAQRGLRAVAKTAGLNTAEKGDIEAIQSLIGPAKLMKMFGAIGHLVKESNFAGGDGSSNGFSRSAESAQAEFNQIQADYSAGKINPHTWNTEYFNKGGKLDQLMAVITGERRAA